MRRHRIVTALIALGVVTAMAPRARADDDDDEKADKKAEAKKADRKKADKKDKKDKDDADKKDDGKADKKDDGKADKKDDGKADKSGGDKAQSKDKGKQIAVFDLRPVRSTGQTDLAELREAVKLSADLRDRLGEVTDARIVPVIELKALLGPLYRVNMFDCREEPACLQPLMRKLAKKGIQRAVVGTYEVVGNRAQLTLNGVDTATGAFTKVELFEAKRGSEIDAEAAGRVMLSVAGVPKKGEKPEGDTTPPEGNPTPPEGDTTDVLAPMPPPPPPRVPDRIQVLGWARSHTAVGRDVPTDDVLGPPYNKVESRNALYLAARYQRSKTFEATASGLLEWDVFDHRTGYEASLRELYVGAFRDHFDIRIGNQRIAWGKGDVISPNDILNPRDLRDPLLTDTELRRFPSFAVRADISSETSSLQLVFQPFFIPDRYDVYGTNWSVVQPTSPVPVRGLVRLTSQLFDASLHDQFQQLFAQTNRPDKPSAGARYTFTGHNFDVNLYYHYGYNSTPKVAFDPMFAQTVSQVDWTTATPTTLAPVLQLLDAGVAPFTATFLRRHHVGIDGVTTIGSFALKVDAAYETANVFEQPSFESFVSPVVQGVVNIEYQSGEVGKLLQVEGIYERMLDTPPEGGLIGYKRITEGVAILARWTVFDVIEGELRAVFEYMPRTTVLQPQIAYRARSGGLSIAVGALYIHGEALSLGDYYGRNDCAYGMIKYAF